MHRLVSCRHSCMSPPSSEPYTPSSTRQACVREGASPFPEPIPRGATLPVALQCFVPQHCSAMLLFATWAYGPCGILPNPSVEKGHQQVGALHLLVHYVDEFVVRACFASHLSFAQCSLHTRPLLVPRSGRVCRSLL